MQLTFDEGTEAFRQEFNDWLDANVPAEEEATVRPRSSADSPPWARAWQRKMFDAGWLVPGNKPEHGGRNATLIEQFICHQVKSDRGIYTSFNPQGLGIITPSILSFGTPEQIERWAIPILKGELTAALGMSEPNAGSDLAGLRTKAVRDGDSFVVNGQKVWTSGAHHADVILAFVRTDPDAPKHKGISTLIIPTDLPGLTRRPFGSVISPEDQDFNEVFFDDVHVPAENLLGPLHGGWGVANGSLGHERAMLWLDYSARLDDHLDAFRAKAQPLGLADDPLAVDDYARAIIDAQALRLLGYQTLAKTRRGMSPKEQSILKLLGSEAGQQAQLDAVEWLGPLALDDETPSRPYNHLQLESHDASWFERYLRSFAGTIAGGTSEIQRNIIAERVLGLPRS
ncbi:acyl-CoA dehydrogenase family protein [Aquihabitans sp. McL0605]|uniref:acyl-CoA dehydrogenase family protein n=1 Tax=Aquihabitans sp. McL0605 TaxID=3415671 RepID=UPI003CF42D27